MLFHPCVLLLQLGKSSGLFCLHPAVLLSPVVVDRQGNISHGADLGDGLVLEDQLLGVPLLRRSLRLKLSEDLLGGA